MAIISVRIINISQFGLKGGELPTGDSLVVRVVQPILIEPDSQRKYDFVIIPVMSHIVPGDRC
jgi:hypothetical protein